MKNKTAVEFLIKEFSDILGPLDTKPMQDLLMMDAIKQAKEMEKEQIMDADAAGFRDGCLWSEGEEIYFKSPEHYYKETYGSNND
jgi:hypothetical protein